MNFAGVRVEHVLDDHAATVALGRNLGRELAGSGGMLLVNGDLGAGKTTLIQGIAQGLEVNEPLEVRSASFSLMDVHPGPTPLVHVDLYRVGDVDELEVLDLWTWLEEGALIAVEWPERVPSLQGHANALIELCEQGEGRLAAVTRRNHSGRP